eukprot:TRINITY_DN11164_c0_g1_i1.p1 TRINITY_DN11164_c0_g1~~TRINITY_DN11164_c0_g1_i1.p1  ORF type:complete len:275 (-),score=41.71 TRINITY_DN11164_c0_g1_i1:39-863(-)
MSFKSLEVKDYLREPHVLKGYRPSTPDVGSCMRSLFWVHNQTWDIWTHIIGILIYVGLCIHCFSIEWSSIFLEGWTQNHLYLFGMYFGGVFICFGSSVLFHLFKCHSEPWHDVLLAFDQSGIVIVFTTSSIYLNYYGLYCFPTGRLFSMLRTGCVSAMLLYLIWSRDKAKYRMLGFLILFISEIFSMTWMSFTTNYWGMMRGLMRTYLAYFVGFFFYTTKFPESRYPGSFDIHFKSHSLWHTAIVIGAINFYVVVLECFEWHMQTRSCDASHFT